MKTIPLTNSSEVVTVSDDDYIVVSMYKWYLKHSHNVAYVCRGVRHGRRVETVRLHRFIVQRMAGDMVNGYDIHHANHNPMDNQRENLSILEHCYHATMIEHHTTTEYNDDIPF